MALRHQARKRADAERSVNDRAVMAHVRGLC